MNPQEFCDQVSNKFKELFDNANISYTTFIRTTERRHKNAVKYFWKCLMDNGFIYKGKYDGWYSISDEAFYNTSQVQEIQNPDSEEKSMIAIESGQSVEWTTEENYKFRLSEFQDKLKNWLHENPQVIMPFNKFNEVKAWVDGGLADLSISRPHSRLDWGVDVPEDSEQTVYVWLDALINYLTVTGFPWSHECMNEWPVDIHVIGKDILKFHAVFWPAFLMAANLPLPQKILAHSHWTMEKQKMSKSRGNVVDPIKVMNNYGVDTIRYYLMRDGGMADDGDYSDENIKVRYRKDLAGQLGNLVSRSISPALNPSFVVPSAPKFLNGVTEKDANLYYKLYGLSGKICSLLLKFVKRNINNIFFYYFTDLVDKHFQHMEFGKGLSLIFDTIAEANKYFTNNEPWKLINDIDQKETVENTLFYAAETARISGILLQPIMPTKMSELLDKLGIQKDQRTWEYAKFGRGWNLKNNHDSKIKFQDDKKNVLFPKLKIISE
ncbi:tRNA synthetases class I (M)-domain-containing protein [Glomus cerebriforme]|uniref:Probable methionine--tRNA ligase, mitochondrial n=1 Tax=Glomus cerebriforme TaxID=658196 RepID=A0A397SN33_9GLOM|nr:tRNA synthetases class I (M)-domain-containing protein [Glomus cerebriforme]